MTDKLLVVDGVTKTFPPGPGNKKANGGVTALSDITLSVKGGEYVCLLGRSGCGKSTLLSIIAGLEKPTSGTVLHDGVPVSGPDRHRMLMFQDASLFPWLDVVGNVLYGVKLTGNMSRSEMGDHARNHLRLVGLADVRHFRIHELSGGMRQRVALARALAPDPDILLMDEPFSALDAMTREQLYADMQRIWRETKKTVFMVTHNAREACCLATRVVLMEGGRLAGDVAIDLPYPRNMNDVHVTEMAARISQLLQQGSEEKTAAEER